MITRTLNVTDGYDIHSYLSDINVWGNYSRKIEKHSQKTGDSYEIFGKSQHLSALSKKD